MLGAVCYVAKAPDDVAWRIGKEPELRSGTHDLHRLLLHILQRHDDGIKKELFRIYIVFHDFCHDPTGVFDALVCVFRAACFIYGQADK